MPGWASGGRPFVKVVSREDEDQIMLVFNLTVEHIYI